MATRKQKEDLIEALKFVPGNYTIRCNGYGSEIVLGTVERETYEYFKNNDISLDVFSTSWEDSEGSVPENLRPFPQGEWHNCDDICHEYGVEMSDYCTITVEDPNGNIIWEHNLEPFMLEESGVAIECIEEFYASLQGDGSIVFMGQSVERGTFFEGTIELTAPFDPTKLKLCYNEVEDLPLLHTVLYKDEDIYSNGGDTTGKSLTFQFLNTDDD